VPADESLEQLLAREEANHQSLQSRLAELHERERLATAEAQRLLAGEQQRLESAEAELAAARRRVAGLEAGGAVGLPWSVRLGKLWRLGLRVGLLTSAVAGSALLAMAGLPIQWPLLSLIGGMGATWWLSDFADDEELR
jgi:hypothetical protein